MIFSKKEKTLTAFTVERCGKCKKELKRKFTDGDCLFANSSECQNCKIPMSIVKIFGQFTE